MLLRRNEIHKAESTMRKTLALLLNILLCLPGAFSLAEEAGKVEQKTFTCGDYEYAMLDDGTAELTKYRGEAEALEVPGELDGYAVTAIGDGAFYGCFGRFGRINKPKRCWCSKKARPCFARLLSPVSLPRSSPRD